ncbi:hypothetical protein QKW60_09940 [Defluviimonas aestuarii]|uniref:hypothetical protein n=1 Tax=Albidovulum aestuarii TaxID=1130726 RepID=UPI00249A6108|nr:hypothetical protein [Defluviimonas aestuarii]MDI3336728.1 hypothetical protein [Defluviimonas aestuarii]
MIRTGLLLSILVVAPAYADAPKVVTAEAVQQGAGWTVSVTLAHPDTGWDHYASGWEVLAPDGVKLGYRELTHPHVEEQPFTRSLSGVTIPDGLDHVLIRPRCTLDGWVGSPTQLDLSN